MKKIILPVLLLAGMTTVKAQNIYNTNGTLTSTRTLTLGGFSLAFKPTSTTNGLFLATSGNVGINTTTPTQKLDVNGNIQAVQGNFTNGLVGTYSFASNDDRVNKSLVLNAGYKCSPTSDARTFNFMDMPASQYNSVPMIWFSLTNRNDATRFRFYALENGGSDFLLYDKTQVQNFVVSDDGNNNISLTMPKANSRVMIGTSSYTDGADVYSLSVNGNVRADKIKVYNTWADYVFEDDYKLPTLEEVEKHIKEKGHLLDIPSAKEVEAKGIDLGDMNRLLLQKIEELTLYTIELNKQLDQLREEVKATKK